jgi:hypothetical protein
MIPSKKIVVPFLWLFINIIPTVLYSQINQHKKHRCGSQYVLDQQYKKNPGLKSLVAKERSILVEKSKQNALLSLRNNNTTLTVSVVVHVVLPAGLNSSVTDAQIQSQIDVLNTDYAGLNADSTRIPTAFKSRFGKGKIRFCLAKRTPDGLSTTGIVRVISSTKSDPGIGDPIKYTSFGGSDAWDPRKYLNIWVGDDLTSSFLGYTFTPSLSLSIVPLNERGFVNQYECFGKGGSALPPYNLGRTAVHEIGHFFNLEHIWGPSNCDGNDDCSDDDGVGDTPTQEGCNYGVPTGVLTDNCTTNAPGIMWMNYMDYVDDRAMVMYTPQQYTRMEATFNNVSWMLGLANTDACSAAQSFERDARIIGINNGVTSYNASLLYACNNNFQPSIKVRNVGTATINTLRIESRINNSAPFVTNWSGSLLPNTETDITLNGIALNNGTNPNLIIDITQVNGLADLNPSNNTLTSSGVVLPIILNLPYNEGFEQAIFPPANWRLVNPDNDTTWVRTTNASKTGIGSMVIDNFNYEANGLSDWMISPLIPARGKDSVFLKFDVAAATYRQPSTITDNLTDTLQILVSNNCSNNFSNLYAKSGLNLVTTGDIENINFFVPTSAQWRKDSVFIGYYDNNGPDYVQVAFRNITNYENNIYIDNIQIYNRQRIFPTSVRELNGLASAYIKAFPNPFRDKVIIEKDERFNVLPYRLINVFGQQLFSGFLKEKQQIIEIVNLSPGIYFIQVKNQSIKLIKQ